MKSLTPRSLRKSNRKVFFDMLGDIFSLVRFGATADDWKVFLLLFVDDLEKEQHGSRSNALDLLSPFVHSRLLRESEDQKPVSTTDFLFLLLYQVLSHASGLVLKKISMTLLFAVKDSSLSAAFFPIMVFLFYWNGLSKENVGTNKSLLKDVFSVYSLQSPFLLCLVYSFLLSPFLPPRRINRLVCFVELAQQPLEFLRQQNQNRLSNVEKPIRNVVSFHLRYHSPLLPTLLQFLSLLSASQSTLSLFIPLAEQIEKDLPSSFLEVSSLESAIKQTSDLFQSSYTSPQSKNELLQVLSSLHFLLFVASSSFLPSPSLLSVLSDRSFRFMEQVLLRIESYNHSHSPLFIPPSDFFAFLLFMDLYPASTQTLIAQFSRLQPEEPLLPLFSAVAQSNPSNPFDHFVIRSLADSSPQQFDFVLPTIQRHFNAFIQFWVTEIRGMKIDKNRRDFFLLNWVLLIMKKSAVFLDSAFFKPILNAFFPSLLSTESGFVQDIDVSLFFEIVKIGTSFVSVNRPKFGVFRASLSFGCNQLQEMCLFSHSQAIGK